MRDNMEIFGTENYETVQIMYEEMTSHKYHKWIHRERRNRLIEEYEEE